MVHPKVYLAGPIAGRSYDEATGWREYVKNRLAPEIDAFSPLRAKTHLASIQQFTNHKDDELAYNALSSNRGITTRDRWDATSCDLLFVNLLNATITAIGTIMEIAWADSKRIPIVAAMEPGNIHEHGMLLEVIGFRVSTVDEAINITRAILLP